MAKQRTRHYWRNLLLFTFCVLLIGATSGIAYLTRVRDKRDSSSVVCLRLPTESITRKESRPMSLLELFCDVDAFCQTFYPQWQAHLLASQGRQRQRARSLCPSEIMTILILFHQSHYRDFKVFYTTYVL